MGGGREDKKDAGVVHILLLSCIVNLAVSQNGFLSGESFFLIFLQNYVSSFGADFSMSVYPFFYAS